jgi:hypothetical protein
LPHFPWGLNSILASGLGLLLLPVRYSAIILIDCPGKLAVFNAWPVVFVKSWGFLKYLLFYVENEPLVMMRKL